MSATISINNGMGYTIHFDLTNLNDLIQIQLVEGSRIIRTAQMSARELFENHPGLTWVLYGGLD